MVGECSHRIFTLDQTDTDTGPNEIVLMTGSRTAEFNFILNLSSSREVLGYR